MFGVAQTLAHKRERWDSYIDIMLLMIWGKSSLRFHSPWS